MFHVGNTGLAMKLFDVMQSIKSLTPTVSTYMAMLAGLCNNSVFEKAFTLFRSLDDHVDIQFYNTLIHGAGKTHHLHISKILYGELVVRGLGPNTRTNNAMISAFCEAGHIDEAMDWYNKSENHNSVTYNILLQALIEKQRVNDIEDVVEEMEANGFELDDSTTKMLFVKRNSTLIRLLWPVIYLNRRRMMNCQRLEGGPKYELLSFL
ncbi:pentatricopeptide repeat-containing protein At1g02060, chloroplastic [Helianthus annuus]|nr:pentatricopeptide repeat-containing protein At1g02060, chloroplastic [Helianthus annuus]